MNRYFNGGNSNGHNSLVGNAITLRNQAYVTPSQTHNYYSLNKEGGLQPPLNT